MPQVAPWVVSSISAAAGAIAVPERIIIFMAAELWLMLTWKYSCKEKINSVLNEESITKKSLNRTKGKKTNRETELIGS